MNRIALLLLAVALILVSGCDVLFHDGKPHLTVDFIEPHRQDRLAGSIPVRLRAEPRYGVRYVRIQLHEVTANRHYPPKSVLYDWTIWNEPRRQAGSDHEIVFDTTLSLPEGLVLVPMPARPDSSRSHYLLKVKVSGEDDGIELGLPYESLHEMPAVPRP